MNPKCETWDYTYSNTEAYVMQWLCQRLNKGKLKHVSLLLKGQLVNQPAYKTYF